MQKLSEHLPIEFLNGEYDSTAAFKQKDTLVHAVLDARIFPWLGQEKNVTFWYVLENGKAVGFNENPSRGWSFPLINLKTLNQKLQ